MRTATPPTPDPAPNPPDPLAWAREFLPHYFADEPAPFHHELFRDLLDPERRLIARVAPRGHAKSTCAALAWPLWCLCERQRRNVVIITREGSLATQFVRDLRSELETNDRLRAAYGDLCTGDAEAGARIFSHPDPPDPVPAESTPAPPSPPAAPLPPAKPKRKRRPVAPKPTAPDSAAPPASAPVASRTSARSRPAPKPTPSEREAPASARSEDAPPRATAQRRRSAPRRRNVAPGGVGPCHPPEPAAGARIFSHPDPPDSVPSESPTRSEREAPASACSEDAPPPTPARRPRPKWREHLFTTTTGITIQAKGAGASFRGARVGPQRPDLIILDDIESDQQVATADGRRKLERWLRRVVMPALAPGGQIVVLGSLIHHDSLLAGLADRARWPGWDYRVYRALETTVGAADGAAGGRLFSHPDSPDSVPAESPMPSEREAPASARSGSAPPPATAHRRPSAVRDRDASLGGGGPCHPPASPALEPTQPSSPANDGVSPSPADLLALWPARWPVERLLEERRRIGTPAFEQEYQANPIDDAVRVFRPEWLQRYDPAELVGRESELTTLIAVDPATGAAAGDFFALWVGSVHTGTGVIYTRALRCERIGVVEQIKRIVAAFERWRPAKIGIETNAYQAALKDFLEDFGRRNGLYLPLVALRAVGEKRARIEGSAAFYENGTFRLPPVLDHEVELQFLEFPNGSHDDAPDVCAMAIELARSVPIRRGPPAMSLRRGMWDGW